MMFRRLRSIETTFNSINRRIQGTLNVLFPHEKDQAFAPTPCTADPILSLNSERLVEYERVRIQLTEQSKVLMRLGHVLQTCGASAYRIKVSMARLAAAMGAEEHHVLVTFGEISSTVYLRRFSRTEISEQRIFGTNAAKLDRLRSFTQNLEPGTTPQEANRILDRIDAYPPEYGSLENILASGIACACFCFLNRGGLAECLIAGFAAASGQLLRRVMLHRQMNHFGVWLAAGFVGATVYVGLATALNHFLLLFMNSYEIIALPPWISGDTIGFRAGIVSAVLFLVPGFPLITSMLDLLRMDLSAGISRMVYTVMLVISAGAAVWLVSLAFNWTVDPPNVPPLEGKWLYLMRTLCSFVASAGFAMLFNSTRPLCFYAGLICAVFNPLRFLLVENGMDWQFAVGLEALAIGLAADLVSRLSNFTYSRVSLSVPAAVLMIPGVPLYAALTHLNQGDFTKATSSLIEVSVVILAIGIGLSAARMLTDRNWLENRDLVETHPALKDNDESDFTMR